MSKLNIVDKNDNIIGQDSRENVHNKGLWHREVHVLVYNNQGEILLQKRSLTKETRPGYWDASAGGHVDLGEDYEISALKELEEETGIKATKDELNLLAKFPKPGRTDVKTGKTNNCFRVVYAYKYQGQLEDLKIEEGKADELKFWPIDKLLNLSAEEKKSLVPAMSTPVYFEIYEKIQKLINR